MFSIIHKEMRNVAVILGASVLGLWVLETLGVMSKSPARPDAQIIIMVLMWFAFVAFRSVEKLAALEQPPESDDDDDDDDGHRPRRNRPAQ